MPNPPTLRFENGSKLVPGDRIGTIQQVLPGIGTYAKGGNVYASVLGHMDTSPCDDLEEPQFTVSVQPQRPLASLQVLSVGQVVLARVLRVAAPQATVVIVATAQGGRLSSASEGSIPREECVKSGAVTREVHECFQPGDIVLAKILSIGDTRRYVMTTAEAELGVIHAVCHSSGKPMIPCSWKEMECPDTNVKELRKCAKPRKVMAVAAAFADS
ncbi:complex component CSL4 [Seminavis robusta]|uniref:Complex component CSL4 n=1 Tax=Seminavis robusta TaxID=568900 RepID=A0A9N8DVH5_9STRA|nr:complex component CSL4 [Seminavis robusta]|eukprot:Sro313_g114720.1 complex component CSL4 (215) ;mRNA; f:7581-8225